MWPVSDAFLAAVRESHTTVTECQVWYGGAQIGTVQPLGGSVSVDRTRDIRRQLNGVTFADPDQLLLPTDPSSLLAPYGQQLRLFRGVKFSDGSTEMVPIGVFRIIKPTSAAPDGTVAVEADDLSWVVKRARWTTPYQVVAADAADAVTDILGDRAPDSLFDIPATGYTIGAGVLESGDSADPWADASTIATSAGYELAYGPDGVGRFYVPASPTDDPVISYPAGSVVLTAVREVDGEQAYNGVYAFGESSSLTTPVYAEAWDEDPASATYRYGPFGQQPTFFSSPFIATTDQAESAAGSMLAKVTGSAENVSWTQLVNPALDVDDVVELTVDSLGLSTARMVLDTLEIPLLASEAMSATARVRRFG